MSDKPNKASLIDAQIRMNRILFYTICPVYIAGKILLPAYFSKSMAIVFGLLAANWSFLRFIVGVRIDKGWILSIIGIEDGCVIRESKAGKLMNSGPLLGYLCLFPLFEDWTLILELSFSIMLIWIFLTTRMITQVMGSYIYWIARLNNDPKLIANPPDDIILERLIHSVKFNYCFAWPFIALLLISLAVYSFTASFFSITYTVKIGFVMYTILLFSLITLFLIMEQVFDKNVVLLQIFRAELFSEQYATMKNEMQKRLFFMKYLFASFLLAEVVALPVIIRTFL